MNYKVEEFKNKLISLINEYELPISIIYYVLKDIFRQVEKSYFDIIEQEEQASHTEENTEE